jgi:hypothetical protein
MAWTKYSTTAADNDASPPNGAPEGMSPSGVNDTMRDMMAEIRLLGDGARGPLMLLGSVSGTNTITASASPTLGAYAAGQRFVFVAAGGNTGATTLNINGLGAVTLKKGPSSSDLASGDIAANALVEVVYLTSPSTQFRVLGVSGSTVDLPPTLVSLEGLSLVAGDILYATAADTLQRLAKGTSGYRLAQGGSNAPAWAADIFGGQLFHAREEQTSGTDAGGFTSGSFVKRVLNQTKTNEVSSASLSNSVISLPAGTYYCEASAPGYRVSNHQLKLRNTTDSADLLIGQSARSDNDVDAMTLASVSGRFTLSGTKSIELQHRCQDTKTTNGLGIAGGFGVVEVYADIKIWRVA